MRPTRDELLAEYLALAADNRDARLEWIVQHPEYADDAAHISMVESLADGLEATRDERGAVGALRTSDAAQAARLTEFMRLNTVPARHTGLEGGIFTAARAAGHVPARLASAMGLGLSVLARMDRRLLAPDSVPRRVLVALSRALAVSVGDLQAYLALPPTLSPRASYRAYTSPVLAVRERPAAYSMGALTDDDVPNAVAEAAALEDHSRAEARGSFADAVRSATDMLDADKEAWLSGGESAP